MFKTEFSFYSLAIFNVESGLHVTVVPTKKASEDRVLADDNLKTELMRIFHKEYGRGASDFSIKPIIAPFDGNNTIFIAILK